VKTEIDYAYILLFAIVLHRNIAKDVRIQGAILLLQQKIGSIQTMVIDKQKEIMVPRKCAKIYVDQIVDDYSVPWMKFNMDTILHYSIQRDALNFFKRKNSLCHKWSLLLFSSWLQKKSKRDS
jgi:hypothetical protein